jgi:hypothetical protein
MKNIDVIRIEYFGCDKNIDVIRIEEEDEN